MTKKISWCVKEIALERHILDKNEFLNSEEANESVTQKKSPERSSITSKVSRKIVKKSPVAPKVTNHYENT